MMLLSWNIVCKSVSLHDDTMSEKTTFDKFDLKRIPDNMNFLSSTDTTLQVNSVIEHLEQGLQSQADIDALYSEWCYIIKQNMYKDVPCKTISSVTIKKV